MCGRYAFSRVEKQLIERLGLKPLPSGFKPRYNLAPGQRVPVMLADDGELEMILPSWGLVPEWAKDTAIAARIINARVETAAEKPAFRDAWRHGRCLLPADGWFEWRKSRAGSQPWFMQRADGELALFAGLWSPPAAFMGADHPGSCTILTCAASEDLKELHERMPVLLDADSFRLWLDEGLLPGQLLEGSWRQKIRRHRVSQDVGRVTSDHPGLIEAWEGGQGSLLDRKSVV